MKLESALALAARGFRVFPLAANTKFPKKDLAWTKEATSDADRIRAWWQEDPDFNIGIAAGGGTMIVDADCKDGKPGIDSLELLDMLGLPGSFRVRTPSGGVHVYLTSDAAHRNRVGSIPDFPGIDIRTDGGYVVGPGSTIDGKPYVAEGEPDKIAPSPAWFDEHLLSSAAKHTPKSEHPLVELDRPEHVATAIEWLAESAPDAIEGAAGDETTYKVAARLRDFGLSPETALNLMLEHWNETKANPPWPPDELETKVRNAFSYATGGWGAKTAAGEFGDVSDITGDIGERPHQSVPPDDAKAKPGKMHFLTYDEMCRMPEPEWLVEGVIQKRSASLLFGKSNTFKSFLGIDLGLSVATGRKWHGNDVAQGRVLFVATEGANGVGRLRIPGWYEHYGVAANDRGNAYLYPQEVCLDTKEDTLALIQACKAIGPFELIVLDIFGGTMIGSETEDITARTWVHNIQRIMRATGAATLTIAHTGWQDETRARMHTHFWGSFDSRMRADGDKEKLTTCLSIERHKDADSSGSWGFRLEPSGETLVPVFDDTIVPEKGAAWPEAQKKAMRALDEALAAHGVLKFDNQWPSCKVVSVQAWREACDAIGLTPSDKPDTRSKAFKRAKDGLVSRKAIEIYEDFVWSNFDAGK